MRSPESKISQIAGRLRLAREQAGLSQGQVAKILHVHRPTISQIEAGRRRVTADELTRFADIYHVSITWLTATGDDALPDRVQLAARELAKMKPEDLERLLQLLSMLRQQGDTNS